MISPKLPIPSSSICLRSPVDELVGRLLENGIPEDRWITIIEQATTPNQQITNYPVHQYLAAAADRSWQSPSLVIIGKVGALQPDFAWLPATTIDITLFSADNDCNIESARLYTIQKDFAMLNSPKLTLVKELITGASREELIWLSGYLAGIVAQRTSGNAPGSAAPVPPPFRARRARRWPHHDRLRHGNRQLKKIGHRIRRQSKKERHSPPGWSVSNNTG